MNRSLSPICRLVSIALLLSLAVWTVPAKAQSDGKVLGVAVASAPVKRMEDGVSRIVASVPQGSKLWAFRFTEDREFGRVIDPGTGEEGWIWLRNAPEIQLPYQQKRNWELAVQMFREAAHSLAFLDPTDAEQLVLSAMDVVNTAVMELKAGGDFNHVFKRITTKRVQSVAILCLDRARHENGTAYKNYQEAMLFGSLALDLEAHEHLQRIYEKSKTVAVADQKRWANVFIASALMEQGQFTKSHQLLHTERRQNNTQLFKDTVDLMIGDVFRAERKFEEAEQAYRPIIQNPLTDADTKATARMLLAAVCQELGKDAEAESLLKLAQRQKPDDPTFCNDLGFYYGDRSRNLREAERLIRKAVDAQPENPKFLDSLGWTLFRQGKLKAAKEALSQSIYFSTKPAADAYDHLGDCCAALGERSEANQHWNTALNIAESETVPDPNSIAQLREKVSKIPATTRPATIIARKDNGPRSAADVDVEQIDFERYRLATILEAAKTIDAVTEAYLIEVVVGNASVRMDNKVLTRLPYGLKLYAVRIDEPNNRVLVKVPDKDLLGWVSLSSIRPRDYSQAQMRLLEKADAQMTKSYEQYNQGKLTEAITRARQTYELVRSAIGESDIATATVRSAYGDMLTKCEGSHKSLPELLAAVGTLESALGENHWTTAGALANLASAYSFADEDFAKSIPIRAKTLKVALALGDDYVREQLNGLDFMGNAAITVGDVTVAREYLQQALAKAEAKFGRNHEATFRAWNSIGILEFGTDRGLQAKKNAFEIAKSIHPPQHRDRLNAQLAYGSALTDANNIAEGRKLMEEAAALLRTNYSALDEVVIAADQELANFCFDIGEVSEGLAAMKSVAERTARVFGPTHVGTLQAKGDFATMLMVEGRNDEALSQLEGLLRSSKTKSEDFGTTCMLQHAVGLNLLALGRLDEAEVLLNRSFESGRQEIGEEDPMWAMHWHALTRLALMKGDFETASKRLDTVRHFTRESVVGVQETSVPEMAGVLSAAKGNYRDAAESFHELAEIAFKTIVEDLPALSEKEQLSYLKTFQDIQDAMLSLVLTTPSEGSITTQTAEWHLNLKANSHELLTRQMRALRDSGEHAGELKTLFELRQKLARESVRDVPDYAKEAHNRRIRELTGQEARLSRELAPVTEDAGLKREWIKLADVRKAVPGNAHLVTFARIRPANYRYTSYANRYGDDRYLAWVIPPVGHGDVVSLNLGLAEEIDAAIQAAHEAIHDADTLQSIQEKGEEDVTATSQQVLKELADQILRPILAATGHTSELILSPDGQLWTIPWAALPVSDDRLLIERCRIRTVVSGRDLVTSKNRSSSNSQTSDPVVFADPSFDHTAGGRTIAANDDTGQRLRNSGMRFSSSFNNTQPLPGTAAEAAAIRESLRTFAGRSPRILLQDSATETAVKELRRPKCLVMSTHGFFFDSPTQSSSIRPPGKDTRIYQNPLLRCGLLLSGCNHAATVSDDQDDGILTGLEIVNTDLRGTELVVLSACETGLGDVREGEGIAGLRQSFQLAGAESVVASLWQVDDRSTAHLMDNFFRNLANGMSKAEALRQAQLTRIKARQERHGAAHPFFWAAFTLTGVDSTGDTLPAETHPIAAVDGQEVALSSTESARPTPTPVTSPDAVEMQKPKMESGQPGSDTVTIKNVSNLFTVRVKMEGTSASTRWTSIRPGTKKQFTVREFPTRLTYFQSGHSVLIESADCTVEMDRIDFEWRPSVSYPSRPESTIASSSMSAHHAELEAAASSTTPKVTEPSTPVVENAMQSHGKVTVRNLSELFTVRVRMEGQELEQRWKDVLPGTRTELTTNRLPARLTYYRTGNSVLVEGTNCTVDMARIDSAWKASVVCESPIPNVTDSASVMSKSTDLDGAEDGHSVVVRNRSPLSVQLRLVKGFRFIEDFTVAAESEEVISVPASHVLKIFDAAKGGWIRSKSAKEIVVESGGGLTKTKLPADQVLGLGLGQAVIVRNRSNVSVELSLVKSTKSIRKINVQAAALKTIEIPAGCKLRLYKPAGKEWTDIEPGIGIVIGEGWGAGRVIRLKNDSPNSAVGN